MFAELNKVLESQFVRSGEFSELPFLKLSDVYEDENKVYTIADLWINPKSKFGEHPVVGILDEQGNAWQNVSLPKHMTETVKSIINSADMVQAVNDGKAGFKVRKYHSKTYNKDCFSIEFVDIA